MAQKKCVYMAMLVFLAFIWGENVLAANRALIIGIADYKDPKVNDLSGGIQDVRIMKQMALALGFTEQDIKVLAEQQADKQGIEREIGSWLVNGVGANDRVLLYFSGHGTQVPDRNKDEDDGLDEAIVPYDALVGKDDTLLTDDSINNLLARIPAGEIVVILDSCHSGTATKGVLLDENYQAKFINWPGVAASFKGNFKVETAAKNGNIVLLAACRDNETAISGRNGSLFTLGLSNIVAEKKGTTLTGIEAKDFAATFISNELRSRPNLLYHPAIDGSQSLAAKDLFLTASGAGGSAVGAVGPTVGATGGGGSQRSALWQKIESLVDKAEQALEIRTNKQSYAVGEKMQLSITTKKAGYVNVASISDSDNDSTALFPNRMVQDNYVSAGQTVTIPGNGGTFEFVAQPPAGDVLIAVFYTEKPLSFYKDGLKDVNSLFATVSKSSFRNFEVRATDQGADQNKYGAGKAVTRITTK